MPKLVLTADEEFMYLHKLDKMQELIPELEIEVTSQPFISRVAPTNLGEEFKKFLKNETKTITTPHTR